MSRGIGKNGWLLIGGQGVSLLGSGMARFGIGAWVYRETSSVGAFAALSILAMLPGLVVSPWAGALVDRWSKRRVLMVSDAVQALGTLAVVVVAARGEIQPWIIYAATVVGSIAEAFQWPALSAAAVRIVPREELGRFNGMLETARSLAHIGAPALAGGLFALLGIGGLATVEVATCLVSIVTLALMRLRESPTLAPSQKTAVKPPLAEDIRVGLVFLREHAGLKYLLLLFVGINFFASVAMVLKRPLALDALGPEQAGVADALFGVGMALGGLVLSAWGGPRRQASGVAAFAAGEAVVLIVRGLFPSFFGLAATSLLEGAMLPMINGCSQTVWQRNTPQELQGRVFAVRRTVAWILNPLAFALAAPIAAKLGMAGATSAVGGGMIVVCAVALASGRLLRLDRTGQEHVVVEGPLESASGC